MQHESQGPIRSSLFGAVVALVAIALAAYIAGWHANIPYAFICLSRVILPVAVVSLVVIARLLYSHQKMLGVNSFAMPKRFLWVIAVCIIAAAICATIPFKEITKNQLNPIVGTFAGVSSYKGRLSLRLVVGQRETDFNVEAGFIDQIRQLKRGDRVTAMTKGGNVIALSANGKDMWTVADFNNLDRRLRWVSAFLIVLLIPAYCSATQSGLNDGK